MADIDAIHQVRNGIQTALAHAFGDRLLACYESLRLPAYQVVHADMAKRAIAEHTDKANQQHYAYYRNQIERLIGD